jgi:uncharacterized protein YbjT (DUF2867 family)
MLVAGATGLVGMEVCGLLSEKGEKVRALVRETSAPEKMEKLRSGGAELAIGDLKDPASLDRACAGVDAIISTASSTFSRQAGDSIATVDGQGQLNLVKAAKKAGVSRFVFLSFREKEDFPSPLSEAKRQVEAAIADMNGTSIQASWFMEVWLSPAIGFDYPQKKARIYGGGTNPISWVSYLDVAEFAVLAVRHPGAQRPVIEFGGPEPLSPLEVVRCFEKIGKQPFEVEHVPESALRQQYQQASDPMQKSFAALMLGYAQGDAMDMPPLIKQFNLRLKTVDEYARSVLGAASAA